MIIMIILLIILLTYVFFYQNKEYLTPISTTSNEAIQQVGSVFNSGNMTLTNLTATGTLNVQNGATFSSPSQPNPSLSLGTNKTTNFLQNAGTGSYNPIVTQGDDIIYTTGKNNLDIVPWSGIPSGIKVFNSGTVGIGAVQSSSTGATPALQVGVGGNGTINFLNNAGASNYNPAVSSGDNVIFSSAGSMSTVPNLSIVPWSSVAGGITIKSDGSTIVNGPMYPNGRIVGPVLNNVRLTDGWDVAFTGGNAGVNQSSITECTQYCLKNHPTTALGAVYRAGNGTNCWCKGSQALRNNANCVSSPPNTGDDGYGWQSQLIF